MGYMGFFDLTKYNANVLIETGTGMGEGLQDALRYNFKKYYSCEIEPSIHSIVCEKFKGNDNVTLMRATSMDYLKEILPTISKNDKIVFWLDAHFPGADHITHHYTDEDTDINLPLIAELDIIHDLRKGCVDTILIDDACLLEPNEYHKNRLSQLGLNINYKGLSVLNLFSETHDIKLYDENEQYIEITPKS